MSRYYLDCKNNNQLNPPGAVTLVEGESVHVLATVDVLVVAEVVEEVLAAVVAKNSLFKVILIKKCELHPLFVIQINY
jgi:hypothetical protein